MSCPPSSSLVNTIPKHQIIAVDVALQIQNSSTIRTDANTTKNQQCKLAFTLSCCLSNQQNHVPPTGLEPVSWGWKPQILNHLYYRGITWQHITRNTNKNKTCNKRDIVSSFRNVCHIHTTSLRTRTCMQIRTNNMSNKQRKQKTKHTKLQNLGRSEYRSPCFLLAKQTLYQLS